MKLLVTGATGFIGRYVVETLLMQNISCVVAGRTLPHLPVEFISVDMLSKPNWMHLLKIVRPTHLLHLAWYTEHGRFWDSPLNWHWLKATIDLIEAFCMMDGEHVTIAGTCAEYDWAYRYCLEDKTPIHPSTPYGKAKAESYSTALKLCQAKSVSLASGRIFLPYGRGENVNRLIPSIINVLNRKRSPFPIYLNAYRDFLHVSDVASGLVTLSKMNAIGTYNISSAEPIRLEDLVCLLGSILGQDPKSLLTIGHERPEEPTLLIGDNEKLKSLGWKPKHTLVAGLTGLNQTSRQSIK